MAEFTQAAFNTFVGGLITEAGELTFPENASIDELNCDLLRDGSRRRRLGIQIEEDGEYTTEVASSSTILSMHRWRNVGNQAGVNFVVVQVGSDVIFFEETAGSPLSANRVPVSNSDSSDYVLDLTAYEHTESEGAETVAIEVTSIKGAMIIASSEIGTILVERTLSTNAFTVSEINFRIRDYEWQGEVEEYTTGDTTPSDNRKYDTYNAGWTAGTISAYGTANSSAWPPLTLPWYSGKDASGNFSAAEWAKVWAGTSLIGNGHYIYNLYDIDRATNVTGATESAEASRFSTVATYSGRVFYSGMLDSTNQNGSKVFFSQLIEDGFSKVGECLSVNDPTAEDTTGLIDSDGGYISIPEANSIYKLHAFGPDLWVFASNGVWKIGGVDDVFRATEFTVNKVTEDGLTSKDSFVSAQGRPYWWSDSGIFTLVPTEVGVIQPQNITIQTIQSRWSEIPLATKAGVKGTYDETSRRIVWMYPSEGESNPNKRNEILIFDETLGAFFPWRITNDIGGTYLTDAVFIRDVYTTSSSQSSNLKYLVVDGTTGTLTFAEFTNVDFLDWTRNNYDSYAEAAYNFLGDLETRKTVPYVTVFLKKTEESYTEVSGKYVPVRDSSCLVSAYWDFKNYPTTSEQEAYRRKYTLPTPPEEINDPFEVVITRLKLRGRGRVVRIRFESQDNKDFHLLGYNMIAARNGRF